jgi:arylsulfatase A-like enzyme
VVLALTSDHGVLPLPEWLAEAGLGTCPIRGGRVDVRGLYAALESSVEEAFGRAGEGPWVVMAGSHLAISRPRAQANGVAPADAVAHVKALLEAQPVVRRVWTAAEIASGAGPLPFSELYARSYHPERSGDLVVQGVEDCLVSTFPAGTSHGSPYLYDRAVPLLFYGPGVEPGVVRGRARVVDLAPTLAGLLGLSLPPGLDGKPLPLR